MKKIILSFILLFALFSSFAQTKKEAVLQVDSMNQYRTALKQNETYTYSFALKNIGDTAAYISEVHSTCGGVTPSLDLTIILPGETCHISCTYQTGDNKGPFNKTINVLTENKIVCIYEQNRQTGKWHDGRSFQYLLVKGDVNAAKKD